MSEAAANSDQLFSRATAEREAVLDAFEDEWAGGRRPKIEDFIGDGSNSRLLAELAQTDLEYRLRGGEPASAHDYLSRFASLASDNNAAVELIAAEFRLTRAVGFPISADEFTRRYPRHADALASRLPTGATNDTPPSEPTTAIPTPEHGALDSTLPPLPAAPKDRNAFRPGASSSGARYRPTRFHAKGGIGEVHVAQDAELGREVALKRIQEHLTDDPELRRRFLREAEITARLQHPGIVPVYGMIEDAAGQPSYAMRFIEGMSLKEAIEAFHGGKGTGYRLQGTDKRRQETGDRKDDEQRAENKEESKGRVSTVVSGSPSSAFHSLEFRKLLHRFVDACNAIEYAHSRDVVHRDLKPANIMLGAYGETLIVDWGLAKILGESQRAISQSECPAAFEAVPESTQATDATTVVPCDARSLPSPAPPGADSTDETRMGEIVGTPQYMSPE